MASTINESKLIRELKKQIQRLKQENSVLRKKNRVMAVTYSDYIDLVEEMEEKQFGAKNSDIIAKADAETEEDCPKCGAGVQPFEVAGGKLYKCGACGAKGRFKA